LFAVEPQFQSKERKMAADSIQERVIAKICEYFGKEREEVTPETRFREDVLADSLDTVEIIMELEEEFGINLSDDVVEKIRTVGQAAEQVAIAVAIASKKTE